MTDAPETRPDPRRAGPILHFRGHDARGLRLALVMIAPEDAPPPGPVTTADDRIAPVELARVAGLRLWRHDFTLGAKDGGYTLDGQFHPVQTRLTGDIRVAFVSCNGEENGDLDRDQGERNLMWARLARDHDRAPFALLLQGGDQIYADEATQGHPLSQDWPDFVGEKPSDAELADLARHLRDRFAQRYLKVMGARECAPVFARLPALSIWDDHDICDGWGSQPAEVTDSAVGKTLFSVARQMYLLFQHGATEDDVPDLFWDPTGRNLGWQRDLPGLTIFAPDLRSERRRRQVMGQAGWNALQALSPQGSHVFMVSSVPLLGPRLSLLERVMRIIPKMQHYEDDLRDQWQSHTHRPAWQRMLTEVLRIRGKAPVTVLSGEIHLATRAVMGRGDGTVHQLVASGISHRAPPRGYARALGMLAGLGESPLKGHPIRIRPLPGHRHRYVAERNFLTLDRVGGTWQAVWHLEDSGPTPPLDLN